MPIASLNSPVIEVSSRNPTDFPLIRAFSGYIRHRSVDERAGEAMVWCRQRESAAASMGETS